MLIFWNLFKSVNIFEIKAIKTNVITQSEHHNSIIKTYTYIFYRIILTVYEKVEQKIYLL